MSAIAMVKTQQVKAAAFINEAEDLLNKKSWFFSHKEQNEEEAAEKYEKAANAYKVGGLSQEAGDTYIKAGKLYRDKLSDFSNAAEAFNSAGFCFKDNNSPSDAILAYAQALTLYRDNSRLTQAAKASKEIAELYETEDEEIEVTEKPHIVLAIEAYQHAAELFDEHYKSSASQCRVKVAELCSTKLDPPEFSKASHIYRDLGKQCLDSNLLKFSAKGYFLQSVCCHLANGDEVGAEQAIREYNHCDYMFADSREGKFAATLLEAFKNYDAGGWSTACLEYNSISPLTDSQVEILKEAKEIIRGYDPEVEGYDSEEVDLT